MNDLKKQNLFINRFRRTNQYLRIMQSIENKIIVKKSIIPNAGNI